jgi:hypothetical protein
MAFTILNSLSSINIFNSWLSSSFLALLLVGSTPDRLEFAYSVWALGRLARLWGLSAFEASFDVSLFQNECKNHFF